MKILLALLFTSIFLFTQPASVLAKDKPNKDGAKKRKELSVEETEKLKQEKKAKRLAKLDTDGDGVISEEEKLAGKKPKSKDNKKES